MTEDQQAEINQRLERLSLAIGQAIWQIQGFEQMLAKYYATAFQLPAGAALEDINQEFERNFVHTAGRLLGKFKKAAMLDPALDQRLEVFVEERHWLVHRLRRLNWDDLVQARKFPALLQRVAGLRDEADQLIMLFHELMIEYFVGIGVPKEHIDRHIEEEARRLMGG